MSRVRITAPGFRLGAAARVAFSPSGALVGQVGRRVAVYSVADRRVVMRSEWHFPHPAHIAFARRDQWFAVRSTTGGMVVCEAHTGQPLSRLPPPADVADDSALLAGPTDEHLVEACSSGTLRIRRVSDLRVEYTEQHADIMMGAIACTADRHRWAAAFNVKQLSAPTQPPCRIELRAWPLGKSTRQTLGDSFGFIHALALTPSGDRMAVLEQPASARPLRVAIIDTASRAVERARTDASWRGSRGFTWSASGAYLVIGTDNGHALLDGDTLATLGHLPGEYASDAAFAPDGRLLALGYWNQGMVLPVASLRSHFIDAVKPHASRVV